MFSNAARAFAPGNKHCNSTVNSKINHLILINPPHCPLMQWIQMQLVPPTEAEVTGGRCSVDGDVCSFPCSTRPLMAPQPTQIPEKFFGNNVFLRFLLQRMESLKNRKTAFILIQPHWSPLTDILELTISQHPVVLQAMDACLIGTFQSVPYKNKEKLTPEEICLLAVFLLINLWGNHKCILHTLGCSPHLWLASH